jgi:hypothetical protein
VRPEQRRELEAMHDQIVGHQRALIALLTKSARRARGRVRLGILAFLGWRLLKPGLRLARRAAGRDPLPAPILLRMWRDCFSGLGAYPAACAIAEQRIRSAAAPASDRTR